MLNIRWLAGTPPLPLIVRGQHGGKALPFLQELYFKTLVLLTLRIVFLNNLSQTLTSSNKINVKSADIRSISQCTEVYFILSMAEKRTGAKFC